MEVFENNFDEAFRYAMKELLAHEQGWVHNKNDSGGETFAGITKKFYPKCKVWDLVDAIEDKSSLLSNTAVMLEVYNFYYSYYWYKLKCHEMKDHFVASMLFNFAVNQGRNSVVKKVQLILKVTSDGLMGEVTLAALNNADPKAFTHHFLLEVVEFYEEIAKKGNNHVFFRGWISRAVSVYHKSEYYFK